MTHGIGTGFLVAAEIVEHADHAAARVLLTRLLEAGDRLAFAPQVFAEFMHIITDSRRFARPLDTPTVRGIALQWWMTREVEQIYPDQEATRLFLAWMDRYCLSRKRLLYTQLAATYRRAGVTSLLTTNPGDFEVFGEFACLVPAKEATGS